MEKPLKSKVEFCSPILRKLHYSLTVLGEIKPPFKRINSLEHLHEIQLPIGRTEH